MVEMAEALFGGLGMKNTVSHGTGLDPKLVKTLLLIEHITPAHIMLKYSIKQILENTR